MPPSLPSQLHSTSQAEDAPLLVMSKIGKRFGTTVALDSVDLELRAGEIHALLGENGAGKSTLMHVLSGLSSPDSGEIALAGQRIQIDTPRDARSAGIAMVHQHFTLVPAFTVEENLALDVLDGTVGTVRATKSLFDYSMTSASEHALARAKSLGWELPARTRVADLPVGTQQRVEIVKALATDARILIFDEPTAVLAGDEVEELFGVLRRLRDEGNAVILIAHKLREILSVADRVTVLRRGRRVVTRAVRECRAEQLAQWMVAGLENSEAPSATVHAVVGKIDSKINRQVDLVLSVSHLNVRSDQGNLVIADLTLHVKAGEIFGIGGVDGNGQTELAEVLVGLRPYESGQIRWRDGAFHPGIAPRTGYIPQDRRRVGLAVGLSIEENLLFEAIKEPTYQFGPFLRRKKLRELAERLKQDYDIRATSLLDPAATLSGGNQQKIVVARALHSQPDWIVAVNPTRGLDIGATRFVHTQLRAARDRGATVVLISTDLDELSALSDRQAILSAGKLSEFKASDTDAVELGMLLGGLH